MSAVIGSSLFHRRTQLRCAPCNDMHHHKPTGDQLTAYRCHSALSRFPRQCLVMPATAATAGRSFSVLTRTKSYTSPTRGYNECLGTTPSEVHGQRPWSWGQGAKPPEAECFLPTWPRCKAKNFAGLAPVGSASAYAWGRKCLVCTGRQRTASVIMLRCNQKLNLND